MNLPKIEVPWKTWGAGLLVLAICSWLWTRDHRRLGEALGAAEAARLQLAGQLVADQDTAKELKASVSDLTGQNELLREAYEQAVKAAPDARPVETAALVTAPVRVAQAPPAKIEDESAHPPAPPPCDAPLVPDGMGSWLCPGKVPKKPAQCVLSAGDLGSFKVDEIVLQTDRGNRLVAGTAEFWRETPPRAKLAAGKFSSALSDADALTPPPEPRWGVEAAALCTRDGCGLGGGLLAPPFRVPLVGWRAEARLDAYAGPSPALGGALGVRW